MTKVAKETAWAEVAAEVNAVAVTLRTVEEISAKFTDFKSVVKSKAAQRKRAVQGTGKVHIIFIV